MSKRFTQTGVGQILEFSKGGPKLKNSGGVFEHRNNADGAYVIARGLDAVGSNDFVTKSQLDGVANGLAWIDPVTVTPTVGEGDITLSGEQTLDGVLTSTDRVLLTQQTVPSENGVWVTAAGAWSRPADFDTGDAAANKTMMVSEGATYADTQWTCTTNPPSDIIDTNNLAFSQIASTVGGVTSVNDAAAVPAGGQSLLEAPGTGAVTTRVLDDTTTIGYTEAGGVISPFVKGTSIDTAELADDAVTEAKIAPLATYHVRTVAFSFANADSTVNIGAALPANAVITNSDIYIGTAFDNDSNLQVGISGTPGLVMLASESNSLVTDVYEGGRHYEDGAASTQLILTLGSVASAPTVGAGHVTVQFIVTA